MEIVGGGRVHVYEPVDEGTHTPGPQKDWQESVVLFWYDFKQSIGGFYRIGHEMNQADGPMVTSWATTFTPDGTYKKYSYLPLRPQDRTANHVGSADTSCAYDYDGNCVWTLDSEDLSGTIRVHDFHPSIDCYPKKGAISDFAPHHMEVAGRATGTITAKGKTYEIDALTFRDHGWGNRAWDAVLSHRWLFGVAGPEFSCCLLAWHGVDDSIAQFGWVVRGDKVTYTKSLDIVGYMDIDSIGNRGGHVSLTLTTGEQMELEFTPLVRPSVTPHHGIICVDSLCKFTAGDLTGFANFETSSNPQHGTQIPVNLVRGVLADGWHD